MTRLINVPIQGKGDCVLVVAAHASGTLMGFVAKAALRGFFEHPPSISECMAFVQQHLQAVELILLNKSMKADYIDTAIACVEIEAADVASAGIAQSRRT